MKKEATRLDIGIDRLRRRLLENQSNLTVASTLTERLAIDNMLNPISDTPDTGTGTGAGTGGGPEGNPGGGGGNTSVSAPDPVYVSSPQPISNPQDAPNPQSVSKGKQVESYSKTNTGMSSPAGSTGTGPHFGFNPYQVKDSVFNGLDYSGNTGAKHYIVDSWLIEYDLFKGNYNNFKPVERIPRPVNRFKDNLANMGKEITYPADIFKDNSNPVKTIKKVPKNIITFGENCEIPVRQDIFRTKIGLNCFDWPQITKNPNNDNIKDYILGRQTAFFFLFPLNSSFIYYPEVNKNNNLITKLVLKTKYFHPDTGILKETIHEFTPYFVKDAVQAKNVWVRKVERDFDTHLHVKFV